MTDLLEYDCPLCGGRASFHYNIERFDPPLSIYRCESCGLEMQRPLPENYDSYYDEGYYSGRSDYSYQDERESLPYHRHVWNARLKNIARYIKPPARLLDVGCAFGGFVEAARDFGYESAGLDVSPFAAEEGKKRGLDLHQGRWERGIFPDNSFDIVTMIEVVEHLFDPQEAFGALHDMIRPGGLAIIQTANFEGMQARRAGSDYHYYLPGHLHYYSKKNLQMALRKHGFSRFRVFHPVDFGLLPKLRKSAGGFTRLSDYLSWFRIARYHLLSKVAFGNFALTSSMVLYAFRDTDTQE